VKTATNKRLLISESHGDANRCTLCRGKPDQHATCFPLSVRVWSSTICISCGPHIATFHEVFNSDGHIHCSRGKGSQHNLQHAGWSIHVSVPSFSPGSAIEAVGVKPPSVDGRLLGLPGPYHRHVIGTFNTWSRGPPHRSLIDTDGGYSFRGAGLPHTTPDLPNQLSSLFT
jgi:hypothetical protein